MSERSGKILLLEQDSKTANAIADYLAKHGFYVEIVTEVDPVLDGDIDDDVEVVLCDVDMTGISWDAVLEMLSIRQLDISAIMLSSKCAVVDVMTALRLGFNDFFLKPIDDWDALLASVDRCARQSALRRENVSYRASLEKANAELRGTVQVLELDQQAGRAVQLRMLPESPLAMGDYVFSHRVIPSLYLSGDYTDYFRVGEHHALFVIADVSGHGSSSAFVTVLLKNLFARKRSDYLHRDNSAILDPGAVLQHINLDLLELGIGKFSTVVMGVLDLRANTLRYCIAGHLPLPVLVSDRGARYLQGRGMAVGMTDTVDFELHELSLPDNFLLALFTDGILEILPRGDLLDKEQHFLEVFAGGCYSPEQLALKLGLGRVHSAPDDIAALFIERRAVMERPVAARPAVKLAAKPEEKLAVKPALKKKQPR